jgi:hypothetical protein
VSYLPRQSSKIETNNGVSFYLRKIASVLDSMPIKDVQELLEEMEAVNPPPVKP